MQTCFPSRLIGQECQTLCCSKSGNDTFRNKHGRVFKFWDCRDTKISYEPELKKRTFLNPKYAICLEVAGSSPTSARLRLLVESLSFLFMHLDKRIQVIPDIMTSFYQTRLWPRTKDPTAFLKCYLIASCTQSKVSRR